MSDSDRYTTNTFKPSAQSDEIPSWGCVAITLDPKGKRYQTFLENNNHLQVDTFYGIKGVHLSKEEIISQGLATEELLASGLTNSGTIGCAASHRKIWRKAAMGKCGYLVLEDDCYTHHRIKSFINEKLIRLMNIDICHFGINTDSILQSICPTGLSTVKIFGERHPNKEWIMNSFSKTDEQAVELHRLIKAFGCCAYFISPKGAKELEEKIFPLSTKTTHIPLVTNKMPACGLDRAANGVYSQLEAFVCQPFLAYTPNIDSATN